MSQLNPNVQASTQTATQTSTIRFVQPPKDVISQLQPEQRTRCEVWTRVMGYHRPVSSFNIGKQDEFNERKFFTESKDRTHA